MNWYQKLLMAGVTYGLRLTAYGLLFTACSLQLTAQSELYPQHFDLEQVTLTDGPFRTALITNSQTLLQYDADRLMTPFVRESGLAKTTDRQSKYYNWVTKHPTFRNWGDSGWSLEADIISVRWHCRMLRYAMTIHSRRW